MRILQRYSAWNLRQEQRSLENWALERTKGKTRFVLRQAFIFTVILTASRDVVSHFEGHGDEIWSLWINLAIYAIGGLFVGCWAWSSREGKYKKALLNGSLQQPFDDRLLPH